jgi:hypothetical protein
LPPIRQARNINLNLQRRQKLSQSLTKSFVDKFNDKTQKKLIENEVNEFLKRETVTQKDLKDLEKLISQKIKIKKEKNELTENLIKNTKPKIADVTEEKKVENNENKLESTLDNKNSKKDLNESGMSGGSDLDKFDGRIGKEELENREMKELEKFKNASEDTVIKKVEIDKSKYNDEWDAINMYNKRMFEERKKREKERDWELRMKNRADLMNQIQQKIKRKYEQELKDREYDEMIDRHVKKMEELENKQKEVKKQQALKEKEIRDNQLREIYVQKRIAYLKNKKYEKDLIEHNKEELRLEREAALERKEKEHEALLKTLKDNELHKQKLLEQEKLERENDIKIMEDAAANEIKRENERKAYYEGIKRGAMEHDTKMLESVIKLRNEKLAEEDRILKEYVINKEKMEIEKEEKRKKEIIENRIKLRNIYDKQVENKKARKEYEKQVDLAQGRIWEQDYQNYINYQNETNKRIRELNRQNNLAIDNQLKNGKKYYDYGMSETEKAINKDLLDKANIES